MDEHVDDTASRIAALVIDVPDGRFDETVRFWAGALSATPTPEPGMPGGDDTYVHLRGATAATDVLVQRLAAADRPRSHLDVSVPDRPAAVARAVELGASVVQQEEGWTVLEDPAGLSLCLGFPDPDPPQVGDRRPDRGYLEVVFLDVPPAAVTAEVHLWATLLGARPVPPSASDPAYHALAGARAVGDTPITVEVQAATVDPDRDGAAAAPRLHVDLAADDVAAEVTRLEELGATRLVEIEDRVTLADPAGNLFCVVPTEQAARSARQEP